MISSTNLILKRNLVKSFNVSIASNLDGTWNDFSISVEKELEDLITCPKPPRNLMSILKEKLNDSRFDGRAMVITTDQLQIS